MNEKILLIDGHSILNRAFYGLPDLTNSQGKHTGAVYGFLNIMLKILEEEQENTPEQQWLMAHCQEYGFILRYPKDKTEVTGVGYEPWHYRYVGVEAAQEIMAQGICLEEYVGQ